MQDFGLDSLKRHFKTDLIFYVLLSFGCELSPEVLEIATIIDLLSHCQSCGYGAEHIILGLINSPLRLTKGCPIIVSGMTGSRKYDMQQYLIKISFSDW